MILGNAIDSFFSLDHVYVLRKHSAQWIRMLLVDRDKNLEKYVKVVHNATEECENDRFRQKSKSGSCR